MGVGIDFESKNEKDQFYIIKCTMAPYNNFTPVTNERRIASQKFGKM